MKDIQKTEEKAKGQVQHNRISRKPSSKRKKRVGSNRTKIPACLAPKVSVPKAQSQAAYLASTSSHTRPRFHRKAQSVQSPVIPYTRLWVPPRLALALALALWLFASQSRLSLVLVLKKEERSIPFPFPGGAFLSLLLFDPSPPKSNSALDLAPS